MMIYHAPAKVNIFLKVVGTRGAYHELSSRFMRVPLLYDTLSFVPKCTNEPFELVGNFNCALDHNTLYKIFLVLQKAGFAKDVELVMSEYALHVNKVIPTESGLGGGSSDAATLLHMLNDVGNLKLNASDKMELGSQVGADVSFFASGYESANVSGIGEVVEHYHEKALSLEVLTPPLTCSTTRVYQTFRDSFLPSINPQLAQEMMHLDSLSLLKTYTIETLNDLFAASLQAYPSLGNFVKEGWFFSGSGSSFFRIIEKE